MRDLAAPIPPPPDQGLRPRSSSPSRGEEKHLQRSDGAVDLAFTRRGAVTALSRLYHRTPCRVAFPYADAGEPTLAMLLNTAGGLTGGDRVTIKVTAGPAAFATVTSAAAEKIYRSLGPDCTIDVELDVADGAYLEWLPQETILFAESRLRRTIAERVATTGRLLAAEMLVFGRIARGERWTDGALRERWRIERAGQLAWFDAMRLDSFMIDHPAGFAGAEAFATATYVGADAERHLTLARELVESASCRAGATLVNGLLLARFLGTAITVRADLGQYIGALRHAAAGIAPQPPRIWGI